MQIENPFQMNDWGIKKCLTIVLSIQLAIWGVIGMETMGLQIPIIRQLISIFYLLFIPGILLLRILKLHKIGNIETILYTVGLSISTLMFIGLFINIFYPLLSISGPLSITPLILTMSFVVLMLCVLSYIRDRDFSGSSFINLKDFLSPGALFLCLIPFLAIFGTYLFNFYNSNIILIIMILVIALIAFLIGFDLFIHDTLYPLAIFVIAISLLFHTSLISMYLPGYDIQREYYTANEVMIHSVWEPAINNYVNSLLSIGMLPIILSKIGDISLIWVFKIIYPLIFSVVGLGLYLIFQKQTNAKIAFFSCFFFISMYVFFYVLPQTARQEIAELFFVLLILLMIDKDINKIIRSFLMIIFTFSLVVSHYGLSYIYLFSLIFAKLILILMENPIIQKIEDKIYSNFEKKKEELTSNPIFSKNKAKAISINFILLFVVFTLTWYIQVSSSSIFISIVHIGDQITNSIITDFLNPKSTEGLAIMITRTTPISTITKYLYLTTQFLIVLGLSSLLLKKTNMKFNDEYLALSYVSFIICIISISIPYFALSMGAIRIYHITLFFLAPFCVIGGMTAFKFIDKIMNLSWTNKRGICSFKLISLFFVIFFMFNSGLIHDIVKEPYHASLVFNNLNSTPIFSDVEVSSAKWITSVKNENSVYADINKFGLLNSLIGTKGVQIVFYDIGIAVTSNVPKNAYIYLGNINVETNRIYTLVFKGESQSSQYMDSQIIITNRNRIYDDGSYIYI